MARLAGFLISLLVFECWLPPRVIGNQQASCGHFPAGPPPALEVRESSSELQKKVRVELDRYLHYLWNVGYNFEFCVFSDCSYSRYASPPNPRLTVLDDLPKTYKTQWSIIDLSKCTSGTYLDDRLTVSKEFASVPLNVFKLYTQLGVFQSRSWRGRTSTASTLAVQGALADYFPHSYLNLAPEPWSADWLPFLPPSRSAPANDAIRQRELDRRSAAFTNLLWLVRAQVGPRIMDKAVFRAWPDCEWDQDHPHFETAFSRRLIKALGAKGDQARKVLSAHGIEGL